jgi:hypothetical protein
MSEANAADKNAQVFAGPGRNLKTGRRYPWQVHDDQTQRERHVRSEYGLTPVGSSREPGLHDEW